MMRVDPFWTVEEALDVIDGLRGVERLLAELMLATGITIKDALALRISDVSTSPSCLTIRGKTKARRIAYPDALAGAFRDQVDKVRAVYERDRELVVRRTGAQPLLRFPQTFLFADISVSEVAGPEDRPPLRPSQVTGALAAAAERIGFRKAVHSNSLRHCHARWALSSGKTVEDLQHTLGHSDLMTTLLYVQSLSGEGLSFTTAAA